MLEHICRPAGWLVGCVTFCIFVVERSNRELYQKIRRQWSANKHKAHDMQCRCVCNTCIKQMAHRIFQLPTQNSSSKNVCTGVSRQRQTQTHSYTVTTTITTNADESDTTTTTATTKNERNLFKEWISKCKWLRRIRFECSEQKQRRSINNANNVEKSGSFTPIQWMCWESFAPRSVFVNNIFALVVPHHPFASPFTSPFFACYTFRRSYYFINDKRSCLFTWLFFRNLMFYLYIVFAYTHTWTTVRMCFLSFSQ